MTFDSHGGEDCMCDCHDLDMSPCQGGGCACDCHDSPRQTKGGA